MATVLYMSMPLDGFIAGRGIFEPAGDVDDHAGVRILVGEDGVTHMHYRVQR